MSLMFHVEGAIAKKKQKQKKLIKQGILSKFSLL